MRGVQNSLLLKTLVAILLLPAALWAQAERTLYITVESSQKGFVEGLSPEQFQISENGKDLPVRSFGSSSEPLSVGFLFDVSGSALLAGTRDLNDAAASIYNLVKSNTSNAEFFLIGFNKEPRLLSDWTSDAEKMADGLKLLPSLQSREKNNVTSLHVACLEGLKKAQGGKFRKKALIVFSDGLDSSGDSRFKELIRTIHTNDILIYFVTVTEPPPFVTVLSTPSGADVINDLTIASGGKLFEVPSTLPENKARGLVKNADSRMHYAFESVFRDLRSQYAVTFVPTVAAPAGDVRNVTVKVTIPPELRRGAGTVTVRHRKKYRAG